MKIMIFQTGDPEALKVLFLYALITFFDKLLMSVHYITDLINPASQALLFYPNKPVGQNEPLQSDDLMKQKEANSSLIGLIIDPNIKQ